MKRTPQFKLKICGMREPENIREVAALHPDYMGFIFYRNSKRYVGDTFQLPKDFPASVKRVGVFVNESTTNVLRWARTLKLDFVQLHGEETPEHCREIRKEGIGVIKAFSVGEGFKFKNVIPYKSEVDFFLFDTKGIEYGGTGKVFDWKILKDYDQEIPFFLSGGLSSKNLSKVKALKEMNIHGLDVNSGVEVKPGLKDVKLVKGIIKSAL